jgi:hypothetical protein
MNKFTEMVATLLKSLRSDKPGDDPDTGKGVELEGSTGEGDGTELKDVTDIMKALVSEIGTMNENLKTIIGGQGDLGEAVVGVAQMVARIANTPIPPKSTMAKGGLAGTTGMFPQGVPQGSKPTVAEFERAQEILIKSYKAGEISMEKSEMISSDMQKAMIIPGHTMKPEHFDFLVSRMKTA